MRTLAEGDWGMVVFGGRGTGEGNAHSLCGGEKKWCGGRERKQETLFVV